MAVSLAGIVVSLSILASSCTVVHVNFHGLLTVEASAMCNHGFEQSGTTVGNQDAKQINNSDIPANPYHDS